MNERTGEGNRVLVAVEASKIETEFIADYTVPADIEVFKHFFGKNTKGISINSHTLYLNVKYQM